MIKAFVKGMTEFRLSFTTHYNSRKAQNAYDWGREIMHTITLRRYEN